MQLLRYGEYHDKIKKKLILPIFLVLLLFPLASALTLNDTTFFASVTNYTIFVDSITLDNVTVLNDSITFFNLTSVGSNFTNTNETFDAVANFIGLDIGLTIRNVNTSTDLFTSTLGNQAFNATFTTGQRITINSSPTVISNCSFGVNSILNLTLIFLALVILILVLLLFFDRGTFISDVTGKKLIMIFIGIIIALVFLGVVADSIVNFCG